MGCWRGDGPAHGTWRFCGRAVSKDHAQTMPDTVDIHHTGDATHKGPVVADALHCGNYKPKDDPIVLEGLE